MTDRLSSLFMFIGVGVVAGLIAGIVIQIIDDGIDAWLVGAIIGPIGAVVGVAVFYSDGGGDDPAHSFVTVRFGERLK